MNFVKIIDKNKDIIYRVLNILLLFGTVFFTLYNHFGIVSINKIHVLLALCIISIVCMLCYFRAIGRSIVTAMGVIGILTLGFVQGFDMLLGYISDYYIVPLLVTACFLIVLLSEKYIALKYITLTAATSLAIILLIQKAVIIKAGEICIFSLIFVCLMEIVEKHWSKQSTIKARKHYISWLWPVWIIFIIAITALPAPEHPYEWKFFKNFASLFSFSTEDDVKHQEEDFNMNLSGFSDDALLGGNLGANNSVALHIDSAQPLCNNLYLAGVHMDSFDGREWKHSLDERNIERQFDTLELLYTLELLEKSTDYNLIRNAELSIRYKGLETKYYFTPSKSTFFRHQNHDLLSPESYSDRLWDTFKSSGTSYKVFFCQTNRRNEFWKNFDYSALPEDATKWNKILDSLDITGITLSDLKQYQSRMVSRYSTSTKLSPQVNAWLDDVTGGCDSPMEELSAIERALRRFSYTREPGDLPDNVTTPSDFLDYFILEKKEGYCTYFATAFTLLARAKGYPARYIQGFCVPMTNEQTCDVTGEMAHAWSEVYLRGIGWVTFEPTAGYANMINSDPWMEYNEKPVINGETSTSGIDENIADVGDNLHSHSNEDETPALNYRKILRYLLISLPAIIMLAFFINILLARKKYAGLDDLEKYRIQASRNIHLLAKMGIAKRDDETLEELYKKMAYIFESYEEKPLTFLAEYEKILYGGVSITPEMLETVRAERIRLLHMVGRFNRIKELFFNIRTC